jgi:hypothetical protein
MMKQAPLSSTVQGGEKRRSDGMGLIACVRRAPRADIYYLDAFTVRTSDVRDDARLCRRTLKLVVFNNQASRTFHRDRCDYPAQLVAYGEYQLVGLFDCSD